jgi:transposase
MKKEFIKQNVGIDISKDDFKVNFSMLQADLHIVVKGSKTIKNNPKGFEELISWISPKRIEELDVHFTMEATGVYYEGLAYFLSDTMF